MLAVTIVGSSATLAISFAGCKDTNHVAVDGKPDIAIVNGRLVDAALAATIDSAPDARPDAKPDAPPDARPDARPDAWPDAAVDAYVAIDATVDAPHV